MKGPTVDKRTARQLAVAADVDPRTIRAYLQNRRVWPRNREAIEVTLARLGLDDLIRSNEKGDG
jgi:hypothetical protein